MRQSGHPPQKAGRLSKGVVRTLRAVIFAIVVNPFAIVAAGVSGWLLVLTITGVWHSRMDSSGWEFCEVLSYGACITALTFFTFLAVGHVVLTIITGWAGDR